MNLSARRSSTAAAARHVFYTRNTIASFAEILREAVSSGVMSGEEIQRQRPPKFLCDAMLGSLARWLRFFGFDTAYLQPGVPDDRLAEMAKSENRWLLTRDRELSALGPRTSLVRSESLDDQLVEVLSRLGLRPASDLRASRCGECNGVLEEVTRADVASAIPPYVVATAPRFRRCVECERVYWPGTHSSRIVARMQRITKRLNSSDEDGSTLQYAPDARLG
jgi:uncharacterized protein with PIN domain